jgi:hypothetical protein
MQKKTPLGLSLRFEDLPLLEQAIWAVSKLYLKGQPFKIKGIAMLRNIICTHPLQLKF